MSTKGKYGEPLALNYYEEIQTLDGRLLAGIYDHDVVSAGRLVTCVNACDGVEDPQPGELERLRSLRARLAGLVGEWRRHAVRAADSMERRERECADQLAALIAEQPKGEEPEVRIQLEVPEVAHRWVPCPSTGRCEHKHKDAWPLVIGCHVADCPSPWGDHDWRPEPEKIGHEFVECCLANCAIGVGTDRCHWLSDTGHHCKQVRSAHKEAK